MKSDKNTKQVSRLTAELLARKGSAAASSEAFSLNLNGTSHNSSLKLGTVHQNKVHDMMEDILDSTENEPQILKENESKRPVAQCNGKVSATKANVTKSVKETVTSKRISMTVRMEKENHLRLRIFSARTRKSCQVILSEALDLYLQQNGDKIQMQEIATQHR